MADFSRLPGPNADLWDWQLRGLCRGKDSSLFFHPEGERGAARSGREVAAKEICLNCPVQIPCVEHALRVREPYGVWGGMTEDEREEHYARQKVLVRAQAARAKAAKVAQVQLKEQLLRDKAAQQRQPEPAGAAQAQSIGAQPTQPRYTAPHTAEPVTAAPVPAAPVPAEPQAAPTAPSRLESATRTAGDLAGTVAAVKRARKSVAQPAAKKGAPPKAAPKKGAPKSAAKNPNTAKSGAKHLTKV